MPRTRFGGISTAKEEAIYPPWAVTILILKCSHRHSERDSPLMFNSRNLDVQFAQIPGATEGKAPHSTDERQIDKRRLTIHAQ
jgi:hypothetical protein